MGWEGGKEGEGRGEVGKEGGREGERGRERESGREGIALHKLDCIPFSKYLGFTRAACTRM